MPLLIIFCYYFIYLLLLNNQMEKGRLTLVGSATIQRIKYKKTYISGE